MRHYILPLALLLGAACHRPAAVAHAPAPEAPRDSTTVPAVTATAPAETHDWTGSYELVGHGFPDGDRIAVVDIERLTTGALAMRFQVGPPGHARHIEAQGNVLRVEWQLVEVTGASQLMNVRLEAEGDRVAGEWTIGRGLAGAIDGRRIR